MLVGHESYLRRMEAATQQLVAAANFTSRRFANKDTVSSVSQQNRGSNRENSFFTNQDNTAPQMAHLETASEIIIRAAPIQIDASSQNVNIVIN